MLLQVHDELVLEVAPGERDALEALVRREMAGAAELSVPLEVSVGFGAHLERRRALRAWSSGSLAAAGADVRARPGDGARATSCGRRPPGRPRTSVPCYSAGARSAGRRRGRRCSPGRVKTRSGFAVEPASGADAGVLDGADYWLVAAGRVRC